MKLDPFPLEHRHVLETRLRAMAEERGVVAAFAHDGLTLVLR